MKTLLNFKLCKGDEQSWVPTGEKFRVIAKVELEGWDFHIHEQLKGGYETWAYYASKNFGFSASTLKQSKSYKAVLIKSEKLMEFIGLSIKEPALMKVPLKFKQMSKPPDPDSIGSWYSPPWKATIGIWSFYIQKELKGHFSVRARTQNKDFGFSASVHKKCSSFEDAKETAEKLKDYLHDLSS